jgi:hypothetical protein
MTSDRAYYIAGVVLGAGVVGAAGLGWLAWAFRIPRPKA